jgi:diaminopimelate decarboxylase
MRMKNINYNLKKNILSFIISKAKNEFDPYYIYDSNVIRDHCRNFQNIAYKNKCIHFASMANIHPQFLKIVKEEKVNVFVSSILHLQVAQEVGYRKEEIIFTSSALTEKTIRLVHNSGAQLNLDSPNQLELWLKLFPYEPVGIRCNIGNKVEPYATHAGYFIGSESRLGFTREEIAQIADKSIIMGLHLYVGTDIFDIEYFMDCYKELIHISAGFPRLEYLNFGGGFGVSDQGEKHFDFAEYNTRVTQLMLEVSRLRGSSLRLILEPGRIIGAEAGFFVCDVTDVKNRPNNRLVGVNASTVQFPRPLMYPDIANHRVMIIRNGVQLSSDPLYSTSIYGCSTYSRDLFSKKEALPELKIGDIVVFGNAGSYSASSQSQFLGFPKPEEYFI